MSLRQSLEAGAWSVTADFLPPSGADLRPAVDGAQVLRGVVHAVNVADMPSARLAQSAWSAAVALLQAGIEPILQVTGRDRNRLALQADLLGAHALGVRTVLCLTGDHPTLGDHPEAKPVYDLSSLELLEVVAALNSGRSLSGCPLTAATDLLAGAVVNPGQEPLEPQLFKATAKERAGAGFFQTQPLFLPEQGEAFLEHAQAAGVRIPILIGTFLLESPAMVRFMAERVPGVHVPQRVMEELTSGGDAAGAGRDLVAGMLEWARGRHRREGRPAGVHVMSLNRFSAVAELVRAARSG